MSLRSSYSFLTYKAILFNYKILVNALRAKWMTANRNLTFVNKSKAKRTYKVFVILAAIRIHKNVFDLIRFRLYLILFARSCLADLFFVTISYKNIFDIVLLFIVIMSLHYFFFFDEFLNCGQLQISFDHFLWTIFILLLFVWIVLISYHILVLRNN